MKYINRTLILVLCFLLIGSSFSYSANPPTGFRNFKWGSSPSTGLKFFSGPTSDGITMYVPPSGNVQSSLFRIPVAEELYAFIEGKFFSGSAWFDSHANFEKVKAALSKEYGQPTFSNKELNLWKWQWPGEQIEVALSYQAKFSRTTLTFVNNAI